MSISVVNSSCAIVDDSGLMEEINNHFDSIVDSTGEVAKSVLNQHTDILIDNGATLVGSAVKESAAATCRPISPIVNELVDASNARCTDLSKRAARGVTNASVDASTRKIKEAAHVSTYTWYEYFASWVRR